MDSFTDQIQEVYVTKNYNIALCDSLESYNKEVTQNLQAYCKKSVAISTDNISLCLDIQDAVFGDKRSEVRMQCVQELAKSLKDPALCSRLNGTEKDGCMYEYARYNKNKDVSFCERNIETASIRKQCVDLADHIAGRRCIPGSSCN